MQCQVASKNGEVSIPTVNRCGNGSGAVQTQSTKAEQVGLESGSSKRTVECG
jgi:hypothetical protein